MRELTCICCPVGCGLLVQGEGVEMTVSGNACPRGEKYAKDEICCPVRMLTSTVELKNGVLARLPVKTRTAVPKDRLWDCMEQIRGIRVEAPVCTGSVIIENCAGTGVDVVATRSIAAK